MYMRPVRFFNQCGLSNESLWDVNARPTRHETHSSRFPRWTAAYLADWPRNLKQKPDLLEETYSAAAFVHESLRLGNGVCGTVLRLCDLIVLPIALGDVNEAMRSCWSHSRACWARICSCNSAVW